MKAALLLLGLALSGAADAQGLFKCRDAAGKITYAGRECEHLGLKPAGEVRESMQSAPALPVPKPSAAKPSGPAFHQPENRPAAAPSKPEDDDRRCFKTAKGTRCNDGPEDDKK
jgi:hypothetical protein